MVEALARLAPPKRSNGESDTGAAWGQRAGRSPGAHSSDKPGRYMKRWLPEQRERSESEVKTVVWTDGSCNANGIHGRGGWAALIEQAGTVLEISGSAHDTTHNRMELTAICEALETLTGAIEVRTDSTYVEKCFNQNWHERWLDNGSWKGANGPVKNRDLWERLFGLVWDDSRAVNFKWIKGHAGDLNNHRVDRLARAAALSAG
jgi:ribonuclease HI